MAHAFPLPHYITDRKFRTVRERQEAITAFHVKLAALYATPSGSLRQLSASIDSTIVRHVPGLLRIRSKMPGEIAVAIEHLVGRDIMPREFLRPDLFDLDAQTATAARKK